MDIVNAKSMNTVKERRRVAIIEDDPFWQFQLRHNLKAIDADLEIQVLGSAEEFMGWGRRDFDLIISDQNLGGGTGLSVWRSLQGSHPDIPFALTSGTGERVFDELLGDGLIARPVFIEKPYRFQSFKAQVEAMLTTRALNAVIDEPTALPVNMDWSAIFSGMMFLSAAASLVTVGIYMKTFQDAQSKPASAPPLKLEQLRKSVETRRSAFVGEETRRQMRAILSRAERLNRLKTN